MYRKKHTVLALALVCLLTLAYAGSGRNRQLSPELPQTSYTGSPIVEQDDGYYFNFGTERLIVGGNRDAASVHTNGHTVTVCYYGGTDADAILYALSDMTCENLDWDGTSLKIDFSGRPMGAYLVILGETCIDLYHTDGGLWICYMAYDRADAENEIERIQTLQDYIADSGYTPADCLANSKKDFAYPIIDSLIPYWRCDTDRWADMAHDIVPDAEELTKTDIATRLAAWMTENIAFDLYVTDVLDVTRATAANDWSGAYSVYQLHAGKCVDFATIYCIMCRELGIPCDSLATPNHVWNIVYLDGIWVEIDLTGGVQYLVYGEDATERIPVYANPLDVLIYTTDFTDTVVHGGMMTYKFVTTGED